MELADLIKRMSEENNKDLDLESVNEIYLDYVRSNFRHGTYRHHEGHLRIISEYLRTQKVIMVKDIKIPMIYKYQSEERNRGVSTTTINKRVEVLKRAINKSVELGFVSKNPIESVKKLIESKKEIQIIPESIYSRIFDFLDDNDCFHEKISLRNKIILYLFLETGIRVNELCNLNIDNIDHEEKELNLRYTKTNIDRTLPLSYFVYNEITKYIELMNIKKGALFITHYGKRITPNTISKFLAVIKKELNIDISISSHKWRHTCATYSLEYGGYVEEVQKLLGHKNLSTTNQYVHVRDQIVKDMVKRASPVKKMINKF
jgi:site-specific recombinase XerD